MLLLLSRCHAVLPGVGGVRTVLSLEPDAGRIRDRFGVSAPRQPSAHFYQQLVRQSCAANVKAEQVATFLGRQITPLLAQEIGSQFSTRIEGTCIKHRFGKCSIKMYDKHGTSLRDASRPRVMTPQSFFKPSTARR